MQIFHNYTISVATIHCFPFNLEMLEFEHLDSSERLQLANKLFEEQNSATEDKSFISESESVIFTLAFHLDFSNICNSISLKNCNISSNLSQIKLLIINAWLGNLCLKLVPFLSFVAFQTKKQILHWRKVKVKDA